MTDIIKRLSQIANAKVGDPMPECMRGSSTFEPAASGDEVSVGFGTNDWATPMSAVARDAIAEITRLRNLVTELQAVAGAATAAGQSFNDINDIKNSLRPMTAEQAEDISRRST